MAEQNSLKLVRISKILSEKGLASRREADSLIEKGLVTVNGITATLGQKALPTDEVKISLKGRDWLKGKVTILLNKPLGYVSGQAEDNYKPAIVLIKGSSQTEVKKRPFKKEYLKGLAPAGRLDIDSTGLLVLTQDGVLAKKIIGENSVIEKEYRVRVEGEITARKLKLLCHGLKLDDQPLKPAKVSLIEDQVLQFILKQGKKRQIRRMCELVELKVVALKRVRIGKVKLGTLKPGQWRFLKPNENF